MDREKLRETPEAVHVYLDYGINVIPLHKTDFFRCVLRTAQVFRPLWVSSGSLKSTGVQNYLLLPRVYCVHLTAFLKFR